MSSSDSGHAKNVANFENLISFCAGYGAIYNPSKDALSLENLKLLHLQAAANLQKAAVAKTSFANATNIRKAAFKDLKPLSTRIFNALAASGATDLTIGNIKTINRKIQGVKAASTVSTPALPTDATAPAPTIKTISSSQQSFDNMIDHFSKLIESVSQDANYKPNETELQTTTLSTKLTSLKAANTIIVNAYTNWSNERILRDNTLYNPLTGLVQTAQDVKKYVKSVYNASSPQFKQISGLEFKAVKEL